LRDPDAGVRTAALQALADLGPPERDELPTLLLVLHEAIQRKKLKVCLHVARSLARLGPQAKEAVPELRLLLKADDREVLLQTLSTLRKIGPAAREAGVDVAEYLKGEDRSVRLQAALVLAAIDPKMREAGKDGLSVLILALRPGSPTEVDDAQAKERVKEISDQLVKVGEPAAESLLYAIQNDFRGGRSRSEVGALNGQARLAALKVIAEIGPDAYSTTMLSALAELQRTDPYPDVREAARLAYSKIQRKH
jgi:HEAT repeat protein